MLYVAVAVASLARTAAASKAAPMAAWHSSLPSVFTALTRSICSGGGSGGAGGGGQTEASKLARCSTQASPVAPVCSSGSAAWVYWASARSPGQQQLPPPRVLPQLEPFLVQAGRQAQDVGEV